MGDGPGNLFKLSLRFTHSYTRPMVHAPPWLPMPLHLDLIHSSIPTLVRPTCLVVGSPSSKTHPHLTLATELGSYSYLSSKSRFSHFSLLFCHPLPPSALTPVPVAVPILIPESALWPTPSQVPTMCLICQISF